jgi:Zn-dependent protease
MLGRSSLNPIRHIDPVGTLLLPAIGLISGGGVFGWAKPTPVDPRNFREPVRDDILTTVAGPASNFLVASAAVLVLILIAQSSPLGRQLVLEQILGVGRSSSTSFLAPAAQFLYGLMFINVILAVFNLIPVPPLDGSHVLRHFLPQGVREVYDRMGWYALIALVIFGGPFISRLIRPVWGFFNQILLRTL